MRAPQSVADRRRLRTRQMSSALRALPMRRYAAFRCSSSRSAFGTGVRGVVLIVVIAISTGLQTSKATDVNCKMLASIVTMRRASNGHSTLTRLALLLYLLQGPCRTRFRSWAWRRYPLAVEREGHAPREEHDCDEEGQAMLLTIHDVSRRMAQSVVRMLRCEMRARRRRMDRASGELSPILVGDA